MIEWGSGKSPPRPFVRDAENIYVSWDMRIPTATAGGCDRTGDSCAEAVLYVTLRDAISGRSLAYGLNVFDTRGSSQATVQSSVDNGAGGTGNVIVDSPVGMNTPYSVHNACSAEFQSQTWSHWKHFVFQFTRATFRAAIALGNQRLGSHYLSSNPPDYVMTDIQIDTEVEWRNGPNMRLGYSVRSFMAWFR